MSKKKFINPPQYDKVTQTASVILNTPYGDIYADSYFNADDDNPEVASEYIGCELAMYRAKKELYRRRANALHNKYLGAKAVYDSIKNSEDNPKAYELVYNYKNQWKNSRAKYEAMGHDEHDFIQHMVDEKIKWINHDDISVKDAKDNLSKAISDYVEKMDD